MALHITYLYPTWLESMKQKLFLTFVDSLSLRSRHSCGRLLLQPDTTVVFATGLHAQGVLGSRYREENAGLDMFDCRADDVCNFRILATDVVSLRVTDGPSV